ncbi:MAG: DedA family protein [Verrucomicrobia bacterium]|nr:DedA family protein [Verrucomicrobiota bacterium]
MESQSTNLPDQSQPTEPSSKKSFWRVLYDWTIQWAEKPYGVWALFALAFAESTFFPIPPDVLLIALCAGAPKKSFYFAMICTLGSVLGGIAGYAIGAGLYDTVGQSIVHFYHAEGVMEKIRGWYDEYGFWGNLAAAITPIPYKVFTITSGAFDFQFLGFLTASIVGRSFRFFLVGTLIFFQGARVRPWIEKRLDTLAWVFLVLLILGVVAIKFLKSTH